MSDPIDDLKAELLRAGTVYAQVMMTEKLAHPSCIIMVSTYAHHLKDVLDLIENFSNHVAYLDSEGRFLDYRKE